MSSEPPSLPLELERLECVPKIWEGANAVAKTK